MQLTICSKPVEKARLRETLNRAHERLEQLDFRATESANLKAAIKTYEEFAPENFLERIPIRLRDKILLVPVSEIAAIVADANFCILQI